MDCLAALETRGSGLMARRAFEENLSAIKSTRQMAVKALEIGR